MSPVINHLGAILPELESYFPKSGQPWTFDESLKNLPAAFYEKVVTIHLDLQLQYSILCNQLRETLQTYENCQDIELKQSLAESFKRQVGEALVLCELLEHTYRHYLNVPREVVSLNQSKQVFQGILTDLGAHSFEKPKAEEPPVEVGLSWSLWIREGTNEANPYRILLNRSRRFLVLLDGVGTGSVFAHNAITFINEYTNAFFIHLGWLFHLPRLFTNLWLTGKHSFRGPWMSEQEKSLDFLPRFQAQIKRRWFELSNDIIWTVISVWNGLILAGALTPLALYLNIIGFAIDSINAVIRAYIELERLNDLKTQYETMLENTVDDEERLAIEEHLKFIEARIVFEKKRFAIHIIGTLVVLGAMSLAIPAWGLNPIFPLIGAVCLLILWGIIMTYNSQLREERPKDAVDYKAKVSEVGFWGNRSSKADHSGPDLSQEEINEPLATKP